MKLRDVFLDFLKGRKIKTYTREDFNDNEAYDLYKLIKQAESYRTTNARINKYITIYDNEHMLDHYDTTIRHKVKLIEIEGQILNLLQNKIGDRAADVYTDIWKIEYPDKKVE